MSKNIVIFSDGTGQEGGVEYNTNVYELFNMIEDRTDRQVAFYDPGIGTQAGPFGQLSGFGISKNVKQCYEFLSNVYNSGDQIYLFGFSRGATTVRTLASFIHIFGILPKSRPELIKRAWRIYKINNPDTRRRKADELVHRNHTMWTKVRFLGAWDTVAALGFPIKLLDVIVDEIPFLGHKFHDLRLAKSVEYARHAVAIDDQREIFHPQLWSEKEDDEEIKKETIRAFVPDDIRNIYLVAEKLKAGKDFGKEDQEQHPVSKRIDLENSRELLKIFNFDGKRAETQDNIQNLKEAVVKDFNEFLNDEEKLFGLKDREDFHGIALTEATKKLIEEETWSSSHKRLINQLIIEETYNLKAAVRPRIKQVWFSGMHTDVGGGYRENELSHISLLWMVQEAMDLGLRIYPKHKVDVNPDAAGKMHDSRDGVIKRIIYRRLERRWEREKNQGRVPVVHESVHTRSNIDELHYEPWILKNQHEREPWPKRLSHSIQFDDYHIWRECFWGWESAFTVAWSDVKRITHDELQGTISIHLKEELERDKIDLKGCLPINLSMLVSQLEFKLEQRRQMKEQRRQKQEDEKHKEIIEKLSKTVSDMQWKQFVQKDNLEDAAFVDSIKALSAQLSLLEGGKKVKKKKLRKLLDLLPEPLDSMNYLQDMQISNGES